MTLGGFSPTAAANGGTDRAISLRGPNDPFCFDGGGLGTSGSFILSGSTGVAPANGGGDKAVSAELKPTSGWGLVTTFGNGSAVISIRGFLAGLMELRRSADSGSGARLLMRKRRSAKDCSAAAAADYGTDSSLVTSSRALLPLTGSGRCLSSSARPRNGPAWPLSSD